MIGIEIDTDTFKFEQILKRLAALPSKYMDKFIGDFARSVHGKLCYNIYQQKLPLKALKASYKRWKKRHGLDPRILIATFDYIRHITLRKLGWGQWWVGPQPGYKHKPSELDLQVLAEKHEYGIGVPKRPAYLLTYRRIQLHVFDLAERIAKKYLDMERL